MFDARSVVAFSIVILTTWVRIQLKALFCLCLRFWLLLLTLYLYRPVVSQYVFRRLCICTLIYLYNLPKPICLHKNYLPIVAFEVFSYNRYCTFLCLQVHPSTYIFILFNGLTLLRYLSAFVWICQFIPLCIFCFHLLDTSWQIFGWCPQRQIIIFSFWIGAPMYVRLMNGTGRWWRQMIPVMSPIR